VIYNKEYVDNSTNALRVKIGEATDTRVQPAPILGKQYGLLNVSHTAEAKPSRHEGVAETALAQDVKDILQ